MSKAIRSVKGVMKGYSVTQNMVREATSNDPWGPTGTQLAHIAQCTFNTSTEFYDIMDMIDKRLNDKGKNWRHVLKALKVLDYCLHEGSELVVTWARQSIYIIKTLREFQYIDEDGRDVGQNVRVAAKEITSLIIDEERLRVERSDRKSWKSRVMGVEEFAQGGTGLGGEGESSGRRQRERRGAGGDDDDAEYRLAIEASKAQEEEDRRKRDGHSTDAGDDDLAKAIKLSQEEEERRRRELEESNANALFGDEPSQSSQPQQPQPTGFNQGYKQGNQVDFFANPVDQNQMQTQPTGLGGNPYPGFQAQPTGFQQSYNTGFGMQPGMQPSMPTGMNVDLYGQQQNMTGFQTQPTGYNPYIQQPQQQQQQQASEPAPQAGSKNPWATNNNQNQQAMQATPTGSNNPFAQRPPPQMSRPPVSNLGSLPEQKTLSSFQPQSQPQSQPQPPQLQQQQQSFNTSQKELSEHEMKLNALLSSGDGMDTYGNTGDLRIPAQHTAPGTFFNSAGVGMQRLGPEATGNPYLRQQFTGLPTMNYGAQGPTPTGGNANAFNGGQGSNNPFGAQQPQKQGQNQDLIQF